MFVVEKVREPASTFTAGVFCAVAAFIAAAPSTGACGRTRREPSRVQAWSDRRKRDVAHLGRRRLRGVAS